MADSNSSQRLKYFFMNLSRDSDLWMRLRTEPRKVIQESKVLEQREKEWLLEGNSQAIKEALAPYLRAQEKILIPFVLSLNPNPDSD